MKLSVREARAQFSKALEAVQRGERVVITKNGHPVAELGPARRGLDWAKLAQFRKDRGLDKIDFDPWPREFDDPAFSREALALDENQDIEPK